MTVKAVVGSAIDLPVGASATLDGSASQGEQLTFKWQVISGQTKTEYQLADANTSSPVFTPRIPGVFAIQLTVTGNKESDSAATVVTSSPFDAIIEGPDRASIFDAVKLDGTKSRTPDGTRFEWTLHSGRGQRTPSALVASIRSTGKEALLVAEEPGPFTVRLRISKQVPGSQGMREIDATTTKSVEFESQREIQQSLGTSDDVAYWAKKQLDDTRGALATVQGAAQKWEVSLATLLGLFATVTFVAGPAALADLGSPALSTAALALTALAFVMAIVALVFLARAGHGAPGFGQGLDPQGYRELQLEAALSASKQLRLARLLAIGAAVVIAVGSVAVAFASLQFSPDDPPRVLALVRLPNRTLCGELTTKESGEIEIAGNEVRRVRELRVVDSCGVSPTVASTTLDERGAVDRLPLAVLSGVVGILGFWLGGRNLKARTLLLLLFGGLLLLLVFVALATGKGVATAPREYALTILILLIGAAGYAVRRFRVVSA